MLNIKLDIPASLRRKLDPTRFQKAVQGGALMVAKELEGEARPYPGPVVHPIAWVSDAQRRAYFASRKGLPPGYTRQSDPHSESLMKSWVVEPVGQTGAKLANSATYADVVIGERQQPFHKKTGWRKLVDVAAEFFKSGTAQKVFNKVIREFFNK